MTPSGGYIKFVPGAVSLSKALAQSNGATWTRSATVNTRLTARCQKVRSGAALDLGGSESSPQTEDVNVQFSFVPM